MNLVALSDASPRAPQKCCSIVTGSHHRLSALIRGRSFSFFTSHPSSALSLSRALAPPQQRSWRWKQPQMVLSLTSSRSTTTTERVWRRLRGERSGTHERSRGNIYEWVTPLAQLHVSRLSDTRAEQVQAGERPRGGSFPLSPDPLRIKQRRKERERNLSMSSCRKRCKREILKFAQYLFRLITGTLNAGTVYSFSSFSEVFHLGNIDIWFALCWIFVMRLHLQWHLKYFGASRRYIHTVSWSRAAQTTCRLLCYPSSPS